MVLQSGAQPGLTPPDPIEARGFAQSCGLFLVVGGLAPSPLRSTLKAIGGLSVSAAIGV